MKVSIEVTIAGSIEQVWSAWTTAEDIVKWNFASPDWCCPGARIDLSEDGEFNYRMEAEDGSMGFDFKGRFTSIVKNRKIEYSLDDDRLVSVEFQEMDHGVRVVETFETEDENPVELQKQGWQCILDNFKNHVESKSG